MHVGFIGVGKMGGPMAGRLLDAGHTLTLFDTNEKALAPLLQRGAKRAASVAAVCGEVETVLVSLPTPDIVRSVAQAVADAGGRVKTFVDLSTTGPRMAKEVAKLLAARNIVGVDSPVSGGVGGAKKGTLAVMLAGPAHLREPLEPVLKVFGKVFYLGTEPGLGQTMKLCNNLLSAACMAITTEAVVMGVKAGLDPKVMIDVINAGSGRSTASEAKFPQDILTRKFDYGFTNGLMYKDVKLCVDEAEALGVPMFVGTAVRQLWNYSVHQKGWDTDFTTIAQCVEEWAGVEIKPKNG